MGVVAVIEQDSSNPRSEIARPLGIGEIPTDVGGNPIGGGGSYIQVLKDGTVVVAAGVKLNFTGTNITVTSGPSGQANIAVTGGGSATGDSIRETWIATNTFIPGDAVAMAASGFWTLAQADSAANADVVGIIESATSMQFTIVYAGKIHLPDRFYQARVEYLSATTAGAFTSTAPTAIGEVNKPLIIGIDYDYGAVQLLRGVEITPQPPAYTQISLQDTAPGYLEQKLIAGSGISLTKLSAGAAEQLRVDVLETDGGTF